MLNLLKREPQVNELFDIRQNFDQLLSRLMSTSASAGAGQGGADLVFAVPPIEAWVDAADKEYHLSIPLPGIDPKDIEVNLHGNDLTVQGEHKQSQEKKDANYLDREFAFQRFRRTIVLPDSIDAQKVSAEYKNGVLEITAPLKESALPKQIEVKTGEKAKAARA
jgi:HSP20 family protein